MIILKSDSLQQYRKRCILSDTAKALTIFQNKKRRNFIISRQVIRVTTQMSLEDGRLEIHLFIVTSAAVI